MTEFNKHFTLEYCFVENLPIFFVKRKRKCIFGTISNFFRFILRIVNMNKLFKNWIESHYTLKVKSFQLHFFTNFGNNFINTNNRKWIYLIELPFLGAPENWSTSQESCDTFILTHFPQFMIGLSRMMQKSTSRTIKKFCSTKTSSILMIFKFGNLSFTLLYNYLVYLFVYFS